jgi:hypothetical protein
MDGRYIDLVVVGRTVLEHIMHKWAEKMNEWRTRVSLEVSSLQSAEFLYQLSCYQFWWWTELHGAIQRSRRIRIFDYGSCHMSSVFSLGIEV